jgi:hypothetical protein
MPGHIGQKYFALSEGLTGGCLPPQHVRLGFGGPVAFSTVIPQIGSLVMVVVFLKSRLKTMRFFLL